MTRGQIYTEDYRPQFSGHETFPMRYGWLKKAVDAVAQNAQMDGNRAIFLAEKAIGEFGVGRNMVAAIRHWAEATGMITPADPTGRIAVTALGNLIFGSRKLDPFMEVPATAWLCHWRLCARPDRTTWHWVFGYLADTDFDRDRLLRSIMTVSTEQGWRRISEATVRRDVECFLRSYAQRTPSGSESHEDDLECPLVELGLIRAVGKKDGFRMVRGNKPSLGQGVLIYALLDFWRRYSAAKGAQQSSLSFEAIAYEPGSPGRVFMLDEQDLADRLAELDVLTNGALSWSETSGLKQVMRHRDISDEAALEIVADDFEGYEAEALGSAA